LTKVKTCNGLISSLVLGTQGLSVGSRLFEVTDIHSKRTDTRRRFRATLRWVARLVLISIVGSWLFLYIDSVYQRRRAESLFADFKSFNFASAGFPEVRDIIVRNGGRATQRPWPTCSPEGCIFELWIMTGLPRIQRSGAAEFLGDKALFLYDALPYIGVRSWVVTAIFEVRNGKLQRSETGAWEIRMEQQDSREYKYTVPYGYEVETWHDSADRFSPCPNEDYSVFIDHGVKNVPKNELHACVLQSAAMPTKRVFDVNLHCLNGLFRSCRFDELAPSTWADYSAKNGGAGTGDPHK
jgi:hypothetical protein